MTPPAAVPTGRDAVAEEIVAFVAAVGLDVTWRPVDGPTAVPGITVERGALVLDPARTWWAGDVLHEAGHLALLPPEQRATADGVLEASLGAAYEMGALCWSYAAAVHLGLDPAVVFHGEGYRGDGNWLAETFATGTGPGVPLLEWAGLTWASGHEPEGEAPFPAMRAWLRTTPLPT